MLRRRLEGVRNMKSVSAHRWQWAIDGHVANVIAEADGSIRIALQLPEPLPGPAAIAVNYQLPGNLRFAARGRTSMLVADTLVDGHAHLPRSFAELRAGLSLALGGDPEPIAGQSLVHEQVSAAIADGNWPEGSVIEQPGDWEFRPCVRGCATPVQATIDKTELRIFRPIVADMGTETTYDSICAQALRFNDQLRHARLAVRDGTLFVESRLHVEQLTAAWLETAAWAVAVACRHTQDTLCVLREHADVAKLYAELFLNVEK